MSAELIPFDALNDNDIEKVAWQAHELVKQPGTSDMLATRGLTRIMRQHDTTEASDRNCQHARAVMQAWPNDAPRTYTIQQGEELQGLAYAYPGRYARQQRFRVPPKFMRNVTTRPPLLYGDKVEAWTALPGQLDIADESDYLQQVGRPLSEAYAALVGDDRAHQPWVTERVQQTAGHGFVHGAIQAAGYDWVPNESGYFDVGIPAHSGEVPLRSHLYVYNGV